MASDTIPTLSNALSRVLRVSTGRTESTSFENSAMSARGRGSMVDVAVDKDVAEVEEEGFTIDYVIIVVVRITSLINVGRSLANQIGLTTLSLLRQVLHLLLMLLPL